MTFASVRIRSWTLLRKQSRNVTRIFCTAQKPIEHVEMMFISKTGIKPNVYAGAIWFGTGVQVETFWIRFHSHTLIRTNTNFCPHRSSCGCQFTMVDISSLFSSHDFQSHYFSLFLSLSFFIWTLSYPGKFAGWCTTKWASLWFANLTIGRSTEFRARFLSNISSISTSSVGLFLGTGTTATTTTESNFILLDDVVQAHFNFVHHFARVLYLCNFTEFHNYSLFFFFFSVSFCTASKFNTTLDC